MGWEGRGEVGKGRGREEPVTCCVSNNWSGIWTPQIPTNAVSPLRRGGGEIVGSDDSKGSAVRSCTSHNSCISCTSVTEKKKKYIQ